MRSRSFAGAAAKCKSKPKICVVTTIDLSLDKLFPDFYPSLIARGYEVVGICADGPHAEKVRGQGVRVITVPMTRRFTPVRDLRCLWRLYRIFRRERFDVIHYSTPKAALLGAIAGRAARCPGLLYTLRGLGYGAFAGTRRFIARQCEKIACRCADRVIAISESLKNEAVKEGLLPAGRITVLGAGSSKGVNLERFKLDEHLRARARKIREDFGIGATDVVVGYAGRLSQEKGIEELFKAVVDIRKDSAGVRLLLVGDADQRDPLPGQLLERLREEPWVHMAAFSDEVAAYIAAMDIFVLASHREGFGNVLIEASALERPVIGTDITGCRDAVVDGKTGILVEPGSASALGRALKKLIDEPEMRKRMGADGREWVRENFDRKQVWERLFELYTEMAG